MSHTHPHAGAANTDTEAIETQQATGVTPETLERALQTELQTTFVKIEDMSGMFPLSLIHI